MSYAQAVVTVGTSATKLITQGASGGILVQNLGATIVYLGNSTVTAGTTATGGVQLPANMTSPILIPSTGGYPAGDLYGIVSTGSALVAVLATN